MTIEQRIETLSQALEAQLNYTPPTDLEVLVSLIAKKVDEHELETMMEGLV